MIVKQIWTGNEYRNFNYIIACKETGEALAIDPLDSEKCFQIAQQEGWEITQILNTHEHLDHTGGNAALVEKTGAKVLAHHNAGGKIPGIDRGLKAGDIVQVGKTVILEALDTPGHTLCHICLHSHGEQPALFSGDTLFNAGAGNCHNGGNVSTLYKTFSEQLSQLSDDTVIYPGHDYIENNLKFTLSREPGNAQAQSLLDQVRGQDPNQAHLTTMREEREVNTFFRLGSPSVIRELRAKFTQLADEPGDEIVFTKLRELRNSW